MAFSFQDIIAQQVGNIAGGITLPSEQKNDILSGLSGSILGGFTQTAAKVLTGGANVAESPVTALAGSLFKNNVINKLGLNANLGSTLTALIPTIITKIRGLVKDQDGDGDIDLNDILITLKGGGNKAATANALGAAATILGGLLKKK